MSRHRSPIRLGTSFFEQVVLVLCTVVTATLPATASTNSEVASLRARLGTGWETIRTPSVRVFVRPQSRPTPARLEELEARVQQIAARLHIAPGVLQSLHADPIDYFLVDDPRMMEGFGAGDIEGLAYPETRLIVSSRLPHEHELVHVLLPLALPGRPSANQPLLQEGLASYLGGNGADAEFTVLAHADAILEKLYVDLASLWTSAGWRGSSLSAYDRYAIAARFVQFLVEGSEGTGALLELARLLCGRAEDVAARPWSAIRVQLEGVYDTRWDEIELAFHRWRRSHPVAGLHEIAPPGRAADLVAADERHVARVWIEPGAWSIALTAHHGPVDVDLFWGAPRPRSSAMTAAPSSGHRFRLHVDEEQVELVDQYAGRVLMRSAWAPSQAPVRAASPGVVNRRERVFRFEASMGEALVAPTTLGLWSRPVFEPR
jgi:hypothetical protein